MIKMIIRKTRKNDLSGITNLYQDPTSYEPHIWKIYLEKEPNWGIVATIRNKLVGCAHIFHHHDTGWIEGLYVHPSHRKKGVGKALLEEGFSIIKGMGGKIALIDVHINNMPAIKFYKKLGFESLYVRTHLAARVKTLNNKYRSEILSFRKDSDLSILWEIIINSEVYLARHGIVMGCHRGWRLTKEDLDDFEIFTDDGFSIMMFREVVDLELAPNIHGIFEKRYSDSKHAKKSCPRFEINLISGNYATCKNYLGYVVKRAQKVGANVIDIWTWNEDPLFGLYNELSFENWGNLYLMKREL